MAKGILLVNLGSPQAPTPAAVRRYLNEFLMDPHVIDSPWPIRRLVVSAFILPFRPKATAEAYASIWHEADQAAQAAASEGPLLAYSRRLHDGIAARSAAPVALAMRYGEPSIDRGIAELLDAGVDEILLVALYPHHAASTRSTAVEAVRSALTRRSSRARLRTLPPFYDDANYIEVLAAHCRRHLPDEADLLLLSYHGLPERHITRADPTGEHCLQRADCCTVQSPAHASCYRHQVFRTSSLLAEKLNMSARYRVSFQSRLGRLPWLAPYTDEVLAALPGEGVRHLAVACPAFVADNLETLEEIGIRGREQFLQAGGETFSVIPCLNDDPDWVDLLARWCDDPPPESPVDKP